MRVYVAFVFLHLVSLERVSTLICSRFPSNTQTPKSPVDENFAVLINNNPQTYILGQEYNITINAYNGHRYISFSLALENDNGYFSSKEDLGQFKINDPIETRFSPNCINMVESTNTHPKIRSEITWVAPTDPNSGCVLIRATLLQHRDVWHMDDGGLTRRICQEVVDETENKRAQDAQECCVCDEARYELTFQGAWNRNLHPKDFPPKGWVARFGDIIGAAHIPEYRFWKDGELASDGMKEYAEHGSSRSLEREFNANFQEGIIRTIIKARGPAFPNLNGISVASVRVDPKHHLISFASKIDPSPDWFVGVSGLELCMDNCTWLEERVIQLYPWDAGTDAGPSYTSADQPQVPPDVIRRMRSNFPNDPRSPFYDETGAAMAPLATLVVKRQRVYERTCEEEDSNNDDVPRECHTHPWTRWSECTAKCGEGRSFRTRVHKQPELAKIYNCDAMITLRQDRICKGEYCRGSETELTANENIYGEPDYNAQRSSAECALTPWSDWTECSNTCGEGTMIRRREFINIRTQEACQSTGSQSLIKIKKCTGQLCLGDVNAKDEEEDFVYNRNEAQEYSDRNGYWNSADGNNVQESSQFRRGQENWNAGKNDGEDDEDKNQLWRSDRRDNPQRVGYNNEAYNEAEENNVNEAYEIENPDILEQNGNRFEIGNLRGGNIEANNNNNRRVVATGKFKDPVNELQNNRQTARRFGKQMNDATNEQHIQTAVEIPQIAVPSYCFDKLHVFNCLDPTVIGNFWFYNYCEDECMLFAADRCDRNNNKFTSLEACESMCQRPLNKPYLKYQQERTCMTTENRRSNKRRKTNNWKRY